jgi:hypothetical protein
MIAEEDCTMIVTTEQNNSIIHFFFDAWTNREVDAFDVDAALRVLFHLSAN